MNLFKWSLMDWLEYLGTALSILGVCFIANKIALGFYICCIADIVLLPPCFKKKLMGMFVLCIFYLVINVWGIYVWRQ